MSTTSDKLDTLKDTYNSIVRSRNLLLDINHFDDESLTQIESSIGVIRDTIIDETFKVLTQLKPRLKSSNSDTYSYDKAQLRLMINYITNFLSHTTWHYKFNQQLIEDFIIHMEYKSVEILEESDNADLFNYLTTFYNNL